LAAAELDRTGTTGRLGDEAGRHRSDLSTGSRLLLQAKRDWEAAYRRGDTAAMEEAARRGREIRSRYPTLDPDNRLSASDLARQIAQHGLQVGGEVLREGWAYVHQGETVLTRALTDRL